MRPPKPQFEGKDQSWTAQMLAKHGNNPHVRHEDDEEDDSR